MDSRELKLANLVFLAAALMIGAHGMGGKVRLLHFSWSAAAEFLTCSYTQPPDCVVLLPGL